MKAIISKQISVSTFFRNFEFFISNHTPTPSLLKLISKIRIIATREPTNDKSLSIFQILRISILLIQTFFHFLNNSFGKTQTFSKCFQNKTIISTKKLRDSQIHNLQQNRKLKNKHPAISLD